MHQSQLTKVTDFFDNGPIKAKVSNAMHQLQLTKVTQFLGKNVPIKAKVSNAMHQKVGKVWPSSCFHTCKRVD